jgi:hypothetical protein
MTIITNPNTKFCDVGCCTYVLTSQYKHPAGCSMCDDVTQLHDVVYRIRVTSNDDPELHYAKDVCVAHLSVYGFTQGEITV